jgi:tetratricopeptide (TPR) repeat protein
MQAPRLKLVKTADGGGGAGAPGAVVWGLGTFLFVAALVATLCGADEARRKVDPRDVATAALEQALDLGSRDAQVRDKLVQLRTVVARRPLDGRARSVYASLLLSLSSSVKQLQAPVFHARVAAEFAPVTVPVVQLSALVLAHARETDEAVQLTRHMFGYDRASAAELLARFEHLLTADQIEQAIPPSPEAWLAWSAQLKERGRREDSVAWLVGAHQRWPDDLAVLELMAERLARLEDWEALGALFTPSRDLPETAEVAPLIAYRALARGMNGDPAGARQDIVVALRAGGESIALRVLAGDVYAGLEDFGEARRLWNRALFELETRQVVRRQAVLLRLARLEREHGEPAAELRLWRSVLQIDPDHVEARRRIQELTGGAY